MERKTSKDEDANEATANAAAVSAAWQRDAQETAAPASTSQHAQSSGAAISCATLISPPVRYADETAAGLSTAKRA